MASIECHPSRKDCELRDSRKHDLIPYRLKESPYGSHMLLLDALPKEGRGRSVLDLGCSDGYLAALFSARAFDVTGIERAGGHGTDFPPEVRLIEHDLDEGLPALKERYSYIVCADILEHLRDPLKLLHDAREVLAPGGILVASLPNSGNIYFRLTVLAGRFPKDDRGLFDRTHIHFFTWTGWRELFANAGLSISRTRSSSIPFALVLSPGASRLTLGLERCWYVAAQWWKTLLAYQFIVTSSPRDEV